MKKSFYCYTHSTPDGDVFYVGKGTGNRAWNFKNRTSIHEQVVAAHGSENIVIDILPADNESDALRMERFLITVIYGRASLVNRHPGGEGLFAAQTNTERVIDYRENRKKNGSEKQINIWLPVAILAKLDAIAGNHNQNRKEAIVDLIEREPI